MGGGPAESDNLELLACANCYDITSETVFNKPQFYNAAWWYFSKKRSFGFSPTSRIEQENADRFNKTDRLRLSWHINNQVGGYRLGNITDLNDSEKYKKYIFIKFI